MTIAELDEALETFKKFLEPVMEDPHFIGESEEVINLFTALEELQFRLERRRAREMIQ